MQKHDDLNKDEVPSSGGHADESKDEDLEDGEIEDDDEEDVPHVPNEPPPVLPDLTKPPPIADLSKLEPPKPLADNKKRNDRKRHADKKELTEAEKSVMRLHKLERMEREKREKYRREQVCHPVEVEEDYATTLEKALAKVLKKEKPASDEEKPEDGVEEVVELTKKQKKALARKRRRRERHSKQAKKSKLDSPGKEDVDENEMLNVRGGSPGGGELRSPSQDVKSEEEDPYDSEASSDRSSQRKHGKRFEKRKFRDRAEKRGVSATKTAKRNKGICLHYLQGHCEDENCPYSHESVQPMKMELCKFYLQECCAKGDKCLYMHSEFPCKFYHTGVPCIAENCKFAHGAPLSENLKQILFKHIETAPKEILGNFPRLSREDASAMMIQAQANLDKLYAKREQQNHLGGFGDDKGAATPSLMDVAGQQGGAGETDVGVEVAGRKENKRNRPSRWQDPDPADKILQEKQKHQSLQLQSIGFGNFKDQDMRINSNGDVDMRNLSMMSQPKIHPTNIVNPAILAQNPVIPPPAQLLLPNLLLQQTALQTALLAQTAAVRQPESSTVDIEKYKMEAAGIKDLAEAAKSDVDIRQLKDTDIRQIKDVDIRQMKDVDIRQINKFEEEDAEGGLQIVMEEEDSDSPQGDFLEQLPKTQRDLFKRIQAQQKEKTPLDENNEFDEDDEQAGRDIDWYSEDEDDNKLMIEDVKEEEVESKVDVTKLGDLSKIDISAEVTKLLSTIKKVETRDPRLSTETRDPRRKARSSTEEKSIYEQTAEDIDLRDKNLRSRIDVDLRQIGIPFKGIQNYTPAKEIDASINSHPPINWAVYVVEIPKPDYTGLKLSLSEAQTTGDPRLKKIFKLSLENIDSPASPKETPKPQTPVTPRVDPRRRKMEAANPPETSMNYNQQLATLQSSPFYLSLTSNQKVFLNHELATRNDQTGQNDPLVSSILQNLGLISPNPANAPTAQAALNILSNTSNLGFPAPNANLNIGPGLLGPAPPIQNLPPPHDFFDPRNNLMNNGPPPNFGGNFPPDAGNFYENEYYPDQPPLQQQYNGNNRDRFRDRPRRGRNNNRNNRNFFRRHNRNNRNSPP